MKTFIFKASVLIVLTAFTFGFFAVKDNKPACAAYCPYYCLCVDWYSVAIEKIQWVIQDMISWFQNAIKNVIEFFKTKIKSMYELEKDMKTISNQDRNSDIAVSKQKMQIKESLAMMKKTIVFQRSQVNTVARRFPAPSDEVCKDTTTRVRVNQVERHADFEKQILRERDRIRHSSTTKGAEYNNGDLGLASLSLLGPVIKHRALYEGGGVGYMCYSDADLGNRADAPFPFGCMISPNDYNSSIDLYKSPSFLLQPLTEFEGSQPLRIMQELILGTPTESRFPQSIKNDPGVQESYMESIRRGAVQNLDDEIMRRLVSNVITNFNFSSDINCQTNMDFVKEVASRKYGIRDARPGGGYNCPSLAEMKWAEVMSTVNTGYIATSNAALDGNRHQANLNATLLDHKLAFEEIDSYRALLLQRAINTTSNRNLSKDNTPVGSVGR